MRQKPLKRLERKITIENMWIYLLSLLKERPMYAYEIRERIRECFGFNTGQVTAYVVLYKLERSGYVKAEWRGQIRRRKYYEITESGEKLLKDGIKFLENLMEKIK
ncbi:MAG: PadR family transcriptional regulator, partial [Candidatus Altiarchaeales archaeon ex4484_43]